MNQKEKLNEITEKIIGVAIFQRVVNNFPDS
jgi:hypothetical protein